MKRTTAVAFLLAVLLLSSCRESGSRSDPPPAADAAARQVAVPTDAAGIEALIEQLAISQEPAGDAPVFTPSRDAPKTDNRVIAYEAAGQLERCGKTAFAPLLKHLDDKRQSVAFRRVLPSTVADAFFCIIRSQIFALPHDYHGSFYRTGANGEAHPRPYFLEPDLFDYDTIASWLDERQDKSLEEMQVEALQWLIEQENRIGYSSQEDKARFLYPLQRQLARIRERMK